MKEHLLKQPKATCVLFSIACKINLGLEKKWKSRREGEGGLWPWKSGWEGRHSDLGKPGGRRGGGSKNLAIRRGGGGFFRE